MEDEVLNQAAAQGRKMATDMMRLTAETAECGLQMASGMVMLHSMAIVMLSQLGFNLKVQAGRSMEDFIGEQIARIESEFAYMEEVLKKSKPGEVELVRRQNSDSEKLH